MPHAEPNQTATSRIGGRRETMMQSIARLSAKMDAWGARPKRRKLKRQPAEFIRPADVARILPLSQRQILQMTVDGDLPGFKIRGFADWLYREADIRAVISALFGGLPQPQQ